MAISINAEYSETGTTMPSAMAKWCSTAGDVFLAALVVATAQDIRGAQQSEQRAEFGVLKARGKTARENVLYGYIVDPESGKIIAAIRHGEVFRSDKDEVRIAIVLNANIYDLMGNFVGRLDDQHLIDVRTWTMPVAFRKLLEVSQDGHHPALSSS